MATTPERKNMNWKVAFILVLTAVLLVSATGCEKLRARDNLNKGVQAYKNAQYPLAVGFFKKSVELDPTFPTARLYLATAYMSQYIPGVDSAENTKMADAAYEEFQKVLQQDPKSEVAVASIASLFFNQKKLDEAKLWNEKLVALNPSNKEAFYTLGVIAWTKTFQPRMEARAKLGMQPEEPGPLKDKKVKESLREKSLPVIEDGIKSLEKALEIDKDYDDAMAYVNLLHREKADLMDDAAGFRKETEIANDWVQRAMDTRKKKAEGVPMGGLGTEAPPAEAKK